MTSSLDDRPILRLSSLALPFLALFLCGACVKSPQVDAEKMSCTTDDNCLVGYVCSAGRCLKARGADASAQGNVPDGPARGTDDATAPVADAAADSPVTAPDLPLAQTDVPTFSDAAAADKPSQASGGATGTGGAAGAGGTTPGSGGRAMGTGGGFGSGGSGDTQSTTPAVDCGQPTGVNGGSVAVPATTVGAEATYTCNSGYSLSGAAKRTCQANGTWSGTSPTCVAVDCGALTAPEHGTVDAPSSTFSSKASYTCAVGFVRDGSATRTCQASGTWSGTAPLCTCSAPLAECNGNCIDVQTDSSNCGGCGVRCSTAAPSTATCVAGRCLVSLVTFEEDVELDGIAVDATSAYWINFNSGAVMKVPLVGGATTTLASGPANPLAITVAGSTVYWTTLRYSQNNQTVLKMPSTGGSSSALASGQESPVSIAVDSTNAYWADAKLGTIMVAPLAGGAVTQLASGQDTPYSVALDATNIYWVNYGAGTVMKMPLAGGSPVELASGQVNPSDIAVDATSVYWTNYAAGVRDGGSVAKVALAGGAPKVLASGQNQPRRLAVDAKSVYFVNFDLPGAVNKVPLAGGTLTTIVSQSLQGKVPFAIAVDSTSVYWTTQSAVMKATPK